MIYYWLNFLFIFTLATEATQPLDNAENPPTLTTANFILLSDKNSNTNDEKLRLLHRLETQLKAIDYRFGLNINEIITIKLTSSVDQYTKECRATWPSGGSYLPESKIICLPPLSQLYKIASINNMLKHELTHARIHPLLQNCPLWVEEYLAMTSAEETPINCPESEIIQCPSDRQLQYPANKQQAHINYCHTYYCGKKFISSQISSNIANICQLVRESLPRESLGN